MLIAEDLLLLLTDDATGKLALPGQQVDLGLGGANLVELALNSRVDVAPGRGAAGRIVVLDTAPLGDDVLDAALKIAVAHAGDKPTATIRSLGKDLRTRLYERLTRNGIVQAEEGRILGILPTHRWPTVDARHESETRGRVQDALLQGTTSDVRIAALVALLRALDCVHKVIDPADCGLSRHDLKQRAEAIAGGSWAAEAVRKAITETVAAIAAVTASTNVVVLPGAH